MESPDNTKNDQFILLFFILLVFTRYNWDFNFVWPTKKSDYAGSVTLT